MQFGQSLEQRLDQRMSQNQIQSLDLLAMPATELRERIAAELVENPALERAADLKMQLPTQSKQQEQNGYRYTGLPMGQSVQSDRVHSSDASDAFQTFLENIPSIQHETLHKHLLEQLYFCQLDDKTAAYAERIINNLTTDGFHAVPLAELFKRESSVVDERKRVYRALSIVRHLDPIGCATKDFKQSLAIQAKILFNNKIPVDPVYAYTIDILEHHFSYLEKARPYSLYNSINNDSSISYKITQENAEDILSLISSLTPFPGRIFSMEQSPDQYIIPTAFVERSEQEFIVKINTFELPLLTVSPEFQKLTHCEDTAAKTYIKEQIQRAKVFIGSLNQREKTILAVLRKIVAVQEAFFLSGDKRLLQPLTQQQIAEELGIHESTVSRTVSGKYIQCSWGLFEMKYFFTNSLPERGTAQTHPVTKEGVKAYIQELLASKSKKLSDQKISDMLAEQYGISVARRTVAKYRKELDIASSYDR